MWLNMNIKIVSSKMNEKNAIKNIELGVHLLMINQL